MILSTDSTANLPKEFYEKLNIKMIPMKIILNGNTYDDLSDELDKLDYYKQMREGSVPSTAQINEFDAREYFENLLSAGEDILHIGFSTALSGSTLTLTRVAEELNQTHENKITVVNSLNASCGQGLLVLKAHDLLNEGKSIEEIKTEIENLIPHACSFFTVEQLKYLVRGGRVGKFSGIIGTILNIKPVLHVDNEGRLVSFKKVISRKKALNEMVNIITEKITDNERVIIAHADSEQDAASLAENIKTAIGVNPIVTPLTQVIGCHTGPGLIALFFFGKEK